MKKIGLLLIIGLMWLGAMAQVPHPALLYTATGQAEPAFIALTLPDQVTAEDWIGCYEYPSMLCYGSFKAEKQRHYVGAFLDEGLTAKKDGFTYGDKINLFYYKAATQEFFKLTGKYVNAVDNKEIAELKCYPLALYYVTDIDIGEQIQLNVDADLAKVVFNFIAPDMPVITGGSDAVKLKFEYQNTTNPTFILTTGNGTIEKRWDGHYYKYAATDATVIINAVGRNNFTGEMLTAKLTLQLDQSAQSNAIFEDENILFFLKNNEVWVKCKTQQITIALYRWDNGVEKRSVGWFSLRQGAEKKIYSNYSRSWKGAAIRMEYKIRQGNSFSGIVEKTFTL